MSVIGNKIVQLARTKPAGIVEFQNKAAAIQRRRHLQRLVQIAGIIGGFGVPPEISEIHNRSQKDSSRGHHDARAAAIFGRNFGARLKLSFSYAGAGDADDSGGESQHERQQNCAERSVHGFGAIRDGGYGNRKAARPFDAGGLNANLPGPGFHDPQTAGEELRVLLRCLHDIGSGRMLGRLAHQRDGRDQHLLKAGRGAADFDLRDAGNYGRRTDGHVERVGAGGAFEEHVGAADVGEGCRCHDREQQECSGHGRLHYRAGE